MADTKIQKFEGFGGIEDSPVSAAQTGALIGMYFGPMGLLAGALIGGAVDIFLNAKKKKELRKKMKAEFFLKLLKRYNTQIFISALERMGPAMMYIQSLGLKPGSPQYDELLKKKLFSEIGYKGNCEIDLYGPAPPGAPRPLIATIDRTGKMLARSPHIDMALGPKWLEACKEMHKAALKEWALEQRENILFERELTTERGTAKRNAITRISINVGIGLLFMGYMLRQKKKIG